MFTQKFEIQSLVCWTILLDWTLSIALEVKKANSSSVSHEINQRIHIPESYTRNDVSCS